MKLTINQKGEVLDFQQERLFQSSELNNKIELFIEGLTPNSVGMGDINIAFRLPDNSVITKEPDDPLVSLEFTAVGNTNWEFELLKEFTEQWGYHKFSVYVNYSSKIIASPIVSYYVEESVDMLEGGG